jgi:hypothetical protein
MVTSPLSRPGQARTKVPHATCEGTGLQGGWALLQHGFFQPVMRTVTHPPWNRYYVVFLLFQRFGLPFRMAPSSARPVSR